MLNPYQTPKLATFKMTILDIHVVDGRGITYIIEMQIEHVAGAKKRFTYYTAKAYSSQIKRGEDYPKLNQVIFIGILDFELFEGKANKDYLSRHQILNVKTHQQELEDLEFTFIELPKFNLSEEAVSTLLEKWVYFIKHAEDLAVIPSHADDPALQRAYEAAEQFGWTQADLEAYEYRGIKIQDERGALEMAEWRGEQRGKATGEQQKAIETARRMKRKGYGVAEIAELTDLPQAEIESL